MPSGDGHDDLVQRAHAVLERNRRGAWTCPSATLYPHQWLWDSSFVAIGLARYDPARAAGEVRALFRGQWANGMMAHMIFAHGSRDLGSRTIWRSRSHEGAPRDVDTTCITQPPVVAIAAWRVAQALPPDERVAFLREVFPKLVAYHSWLYRERDLDGSGLVTLLHPWECGLDSTPPWMHALRRMRLPRWLRIAERARLARVLRSARYDTRLLPASERATDDDGLRMLALAVRAEKFGFELRRIPRDDRVVLIEDVAFNSLLVVANRSLVSIASELRDAVPDELTYAMTRTPAAIETLWDDEAAHYCSRDAVSGQLVQERTIATFLPLWAGVANAERARRLLASLDDPTSYGPAFPVPSVPLDAPEFQESRYWKGPTWVNMNWAIIEALRERGELDRAEDLRLRTLDMVEQSGCSEYFSALTGEGYGADDFSWTAALVIDLARSPGRARAPSA